MKIKLSDYIFEYLKEKNITTTFSVSGGAAAHLLDSAKKYNIEYIANYHEQASAMAAEGYSRIKNIPALVLVTNGPGSSNTITGVVGAFQDSIPMFVISGQVPTTQTLNTQPLGLRQLGVQEVDIIKMVDPITKYAHQITDATNIKYNLDKAYHECTTGRKGPVWLDIPLDIQSTIIETDKLRGFNPPLINYPSYDIKSLVNLILKAKRPLIVTGNGIHLSNTEKIFKDLINHLQIPAVSTWTSKDLFNWEDPLFVGNFGLLGERAGNFAIQKSDLILVLGSRLSIPNIGYKSELFSPNSTKIMVDIDKNELNKTTLNIDYKIEANLNEFIPNLIKNLPKDMPKWESWIQENNKLKHKYPVFLPEYRENNIKINSFYFIEVLSKHLKNHIVVTDMGTSYTCTHQSLRTNGKSRLYTSSACCSMGFGLPGAIGTYFGDKTKEIILIAGDGGMQMNIQELQTIVHHNIPIKIFILNNQSYLAISLMQDNLFNSNYIGSTPDSGVSSPDFCKIATAYGIKSIKLNNNKELDLQIESVLNYKGPILCEIMMPPNQLLIPRVQSKKNNKGEIESTSLENMFPFLDDIEFKSIMNK
jgi:acetolactate synthase I/II/III large subunit|tara:strand:- start:1016 stop:2785 length:1770 start_codon:yes stop_codon:yes gene_type:complete